MMTFSMLAMSLPARAATSDIGWRLLTGWRERSVSLPGCKGIYNEQGERRRVSDPMMARHRVADATPLARSPRLPRPGRFLADPLLPGRAVVEERALRTPGVLLGTQHVGVGAQQLDHRRPLGLGDEVLDGPPQAL